jgi:transcriptional regulator with XRE-family HTH domain
MTTYYNCYNHYIKELENMRLRIKEVAEAQGLNRNQLQLKSGVTLPLLTRYWNNTTTEIRLEALEKIAKALGVNPRELLISDDEARLLAEEKEDK